MIFEKQMAFLTGMQTLSIDFQSVPQIWRQTLGKTKITTADCQNLTFSDILSYLQ